MNIQNIGFILLLFGWLGCAAPPAADSGATYADVEMAGAMKDVMWQGKLDGLIALDTIRPRDGLYGLGPLSFLAGELLINDGQAYVSRVAADSGMMVEKTFAVSAPFFVYAHVTEWEEIRLPAKIKTIQALEAFIDAATKTSKRPFAFKLKGKVVQATIHIQNLPSGTSVSSPAEAHMGQTDYQVQNEAVEIVGFFSTAHKGIFTHHDSFVHMHLITADERKMGHLDAVEFGEMRLFLPKK